MNILNYIYQEPCKDKNNILNSLKNEKLPLYLWGIGGVANTLIKYMRTNHIQLSGILCDKGFYENIWNNYNVLSFQSELLPDEYAILVGHSHYEMKPEQLDSRIKNVYRVANCCCIKAENISYDFLAAHQEDYTRAYNIMQDKKSKDCFIAYLNARINGNCDYIYNHVDCDYNYFDNDIWKITQNETFADVGAYTGDTIELFLKVSKNQYNHVYAFEPSPLNYKSLCKYASANGINSCTYYNLGLWNEIGKKYLFAESGEESILSDDNGAHEINVATIDSILSDKSITLLKINTFVGNREILEGAQNILKKDSPKLAITVGFDERAIMQLPILIKQINPDYKIYFRYHAGMPARLILYAIC